MESVKEGDARRGGGKAREPRVEGVRGGWGVGTGKWRCPGEPGTGTTKDGQLVAMPREPREHGLVLEDGPIQQLP